MRRAFGHIFLMVGSKISSAGTGKCLFLWGHSPCGASRPDADPREASSVATGFTSQEPSSRKEVPGSPLVAGAVQTDVCRVLTVTLSSGQADAAPSMLGSRFPQEGLDLSRETGGKPMGLPL